MNKAAIYQDVESLSSSSFPAYDADDRALQEADAVGPLRSRSMRNSISLFEGSVMALPQDISPVNSEAMESLVRSHQMDWIAQSFDPEKSFMKVLWTGPESGRVALLFRCLKGAVVPAHKHIGDAHTFVLKGKLEVRGTTIGAGDYLYEANGMVHHATTAIEDTEYLFIMQGAVLFFDDKQFLGYQGWEEFHRERAKQNAAG